MLGGYGAIASMISSLKANKGLRKKRLNVFHRGGRFSEYREEYRKAAKGKLNFKEASKEELAQIRHGIKRKRRRERVVFYSVILAFVPLLAWGLTSMFASIGKSEKQMLEEERAEALENAHTAQQVFFMSVRRGDKWFEQYEWQKAVVDYRIALDIFPTEPLALKKLAQTYTYGCINNNIYCEQADSMIAAMLILDPANKDYRKLIELLANSEGQITESSHQLEVR